MSTNPSQLSELNARKSIDFRPVAVVPRPARDLSAATSASRFRDLGVVIERLFAFYEAMKTGKPLANGDEMLTQVGGALARSTRGRSQA